MTNVTIRLNSDDKAEFSRICEKIGLSVSAAFTVFVKTVINEKRIPFELSARERDDFYSEANLRHQTKDSPAFRDDFYSEANLRHLEELRRLDDAGQLHFVTKTWEELKAMEK